MSNVLLTYVVSAMKDYFKSSYIALLTYADRKASILKGVRLSGEQLSQISSSQLTVDPGVAELLPFQRLASVGRHFADIDPKLDVLAPLRRPYRNRKVNLLVRLEDLVTRRHALKHEMQIDIDFDGLALERSIHDLTVGISRVYETITGHFWWPYELPVSSKFSLRPGRKQLTAKAHARDLEAAEDSVAGSIGGGQAKVAGP